jgi:hypothetical protein
MPDITLEEVEAYAERAARRQYNPDDKLRRHEAAEALTALGFPTTYDTLAAAAMRRIGWA